MNLMVGDPKINRRVGAKEVTPPKYRTRKPTPIRQAKFRAPHCKAAESMPTHYRPCQFMLAEIVAVDSTEAFA